MVTALIERLFDRRATPVRVALLLAIGGGYLTLLADPVERQDPLGWVFALASVAVAWESVRRPLVCSLLQTALLAGGEALGVGSVIVLKVLAGIGLFELAMRRTGRPLAVGAAALTAVYAVLGVTHSLEDPAGVVFQVLVVIGGPVVLGAYIGGVRARARQAEERAAEQERLRVSEAQVVRVAERTAIARELHDLVAHHIASIVLRVGVARHVWPDGGERVEQVLDDVHGTGTAALADLRRLVAVLRDPGAPDTAHGELVDPGGLPAAVTSVVDRARQVGLHVDATVDPAIARLDAVHGLAVLRLVQEGLTNVAEHAGPDARVLLSAELEGEDVRLEISDDGQGTRDGAGAGGSGHGLIGMRERVELLGGTLRAGPDGTGWRLAALLPAGGLRVVSV